jgi:hypothetical protein
VPRFRRGARGRPHRPISHLKDGEPIPIVARSERPEIRPPFQRPRQAREGAPAFDTVLDEQAQRDQMHGRRLPGTPFGPIPGMLGHVAVQHSAAPTSPVDPTLVSAWTWT